jgi:TrmH family RNA methyltransferase
MKRERITSRDNPLIAALRRQRQEALAYRRTGWIWVEGDHLCAAALARGVPLAQVVVSDAAADRADLAGLMAAAERVVQVPDALFVELSGLPSPTGVGAVLAQPAQPVAGLAGRPAVVLDRLQDPGNVGSILRSAAALGVPQVLALKGTAGLWTPKVLRAGMGAHFALHLVDGADEGVIDALGVPLLVTSSHAAHRLDDGRWPWPAAWVFGHEGQGVDPRLATRAANTVGIPQPGGEESLNVAAAAAICLYASSLRAAVPGRG